MKCFKGVKCVRKKDILINQECGRIVEHSTLQVVTSSIDS